MGTNNKRLLWIDWTKATCIFTIVYGHLLDDTIAPVWMVHLKQIGWAYAVTLFFLISGYLFKTKQLGSKDFVFSNIKALIIPYFFFNAVSAILEYRLQSHETWINGLKGFFLAEGYAFAGPAWFLVSLFLIRMITYFFAKKQKWSYATLFALLCVSISIVSPFHIPFGISSCFIAFPFFYLGIVLRKICLWKHYSHLPLMGKLLIAGILIVLTIFIHRSGINAIDISRAYIADYGLVRYLYCATACMTVLSLCGLLNSIESKLITRISLGTITIMGFHCTILQIIWAYGSKFPENMKIIFQQPYIILTTFILSCVVADILRTYTPNLVGKGA